MGQLNFSTFLTKLQALQNGIEISSPVELSVKRSYWGAPPDSLTDLPCFVNALSEPDRTLGFGSVEQHPRVNVQLFAAEALVEDTRSSRIATEFWFAAKDAFDTDHTIGGSVEFATLRGADPTVPVILTHAGKAYIGFNAYLDIIDVDDF